MEKSSRGFAGMPEEKQREIARRGGIAVSQNREHMAKIGRKGGIKSKRSKGKHVSGINYPQSF